MSADDAILTPAWTALPPPNLAQDRFPHVLKEAEIETFRLGDALQSSLLCGERLGTYLKRVLLTGDISKSKMCVMLFGNQEFLERF